MSGPNSKAGHSFLQLLVKFLIKLISNGFQPFRYSCGDGDVFEPAVLGGTVPVLHTVMGHDDIPWL